MHATGDYLLTAALWLAALLQFAVVRDWTVRESKRGDSYRWLLCAGLMGLALRFSFVLADVGRLAVPLHSLLSMLLMAVGLVGLSLEQLLRLPAPGKEPHRRASDFVPIDDGEAVSR